VNSKPGCWQARAGTTTRATSRWHDDPRDLAFTTTVGTPMDGVAVTRRLQAPLAEAGLPRQRFHDLRHARASLLLAQGVPARVVMETLGHSQIALTMNTTSCRPWSIGGAHPTRRPRR